MADSQWMSIRLWSLKIWFQLHISFFLEKFLRWQATQYMSVCSWYVSHSLSNTHFVVLPFRFLPILFYFWDNGRIIATHQISSMKLMVELALLKEKKWPSNRNSLLETAQILFRVKMTLGFLFLILSNDWESKYQNGNDERDIMERKMLSS